MNRDTRTNLHTNLQVYTLTKFSSRVPLPTMYTPLWFISHDKLITISSSIIFISLVILLSPIFNHECPFTKTYSNSSEYSHITYTCFTESANYLNWRTRGISCRQPHLAQPVLYYYSTAMFPLPPLSSARLERHVQAVTILFSVLLVYFSENVLQEDGNKG